MVKAFTVTGISGAPSATTAHGLFRFQTAEAGEITLAVPQDKLPGLAGLAMGYGRSQSGGVQALEVTAFDLGRLNDGSAVLSLSLSGGLSNVAYGLPAEAVAALRGLLNRL